jgi:TonB family protein
MEGKEFSVTCAHIVRLLFMGAMLSGEYETLENAAQKTTSASLQTKAGSVEHNRVMELESGKFPMEQSPATRPADMANDLLIQPESGTEAAALMSGHELDAFLGKAFEEKPIWADLYDGIRDLFFPPKLPPLELTSTPIPVPDRMAVKPNPWAIGISSAVNIAILLIALFLVGRKIIEAVKPPLLATNIDVGNMDLKAPKAATTAGGGGGGGDHSLVDPSKGRLPPRMKNPIVPPMVPVLDNPKLAIPSAIDVQKNIQLPDNPSLPNIGLSRSTNVALASNGQGGGGGMGTGYGGGLGSGNGNGFGPGSGGNAGGGLYRVGGGVSAPVPIFQPEAEFSDEARRAKYQGVCLISLIVDAQGNPQNEHVIRTLGMGLDEKALEAVRKYKFKPAMKGRTPVPVMITIEVNFRLY